MQEDRATVDILDLDFSTTGDLLFLRNILNTCAVTGMIFHVNVVIDTIRDRYVLEELAVGFLVECVVC